MINPRYFARWFLFIFFVCCCAQTWADVDRIVVIKADGLPFDLLDRLVKEKDPYTGKSVLPWIDHVFYENGTRLSSFYSRGLSLSAPSWSMLDTGRHSVIKGNLEFDRLTLDAYDYMNVFTFILKNSAGRRTDTIAAQMLGEHQIPLLSDAYSESERYLSAQVVARGQQPISLPGGLRRLLTLQNPKEWLDEWAVGLEGHGLVFEVLEREFLAKLQDTRIRYLDFLVPFFDHTAHITREPEAQLRAIQQIDAVVRNVWNAVQKSSLAARTVLILVSDHGMNTTPDIYSQGYNLMDLFAGAGGGGHHILTNRQPLTAYSLKSLSPTVPAVITPSVDSYYLKGRSGDYPTLAIDADGNERASIYLRQSDLNVLQILGEQLLRKDLAPVVRAAAVDAFLKHVDRNRPAWNALLSNNSAKYSSQLRTLKNLLDVKREGIASSRHKIENLIPKKSFGVLNSVHDLQNYVVGLAEHGLILEEDGSLDMDKSFVRVNHFSLLRGARTRNNVQPSVSSEPVDFIAVAIPPSDLVAALPSDLLPVDTAVWLFRERENQALILGRHDASGRVHLRYLPVSQLTQDRHEKFHFSILPWRDGLPLNIREDLSLPDGERDAWLNTWHTDAEWLEMFHHGRYSNAVVSLHEQFAESPDGKKELARSDFIVFANNHWNFNYRGFNPGGNHGAFFRPSTQATLMFAGGDGTGIPRGQLVERPYDTLSFVPTVLSLKGNLPNDKSFPGPIIREVFRP